VGCNTDDLNIKPFYPLIKEVSFNNLLSEGYSRIPEIDMIGVSRDYDRFSHEVFFYDVEGEKIGVEYWILNSAIVSLDSNIVQKKLQEFNFMMITGYSKGKLFTVKNLDNHGIYLAKINDTNNRLQIEYHYLFLEDE